MGHPGPLGDKAGMLNLDQIRWVTEDRTSLKLTWDIFICIEVLPPGFYCILCFLTQSLRMWFICLPYVGM